MTELLQKALQKVATLPQEEQDAIASQIIETLQDEAAWKQTLAKDPEKLRRLAEEARRDSQTLISFQKCVASSSTSGG
jgi:DNA-binding protein H-NS